MTPNQTTILQWLVEAGRPCSPTDIVRRCQLVSCEAGRKNILECLGRLMQKKLVARANRRTGFCDRSEPLYAATPAGRAFVASGKRITSGPNGPHTGAGKPREGTFRQRLWNAFRIQKKATLPQLIEIAREARDGRVESNALSYLKSLVRAGVAARLPAREKGLALTSPGHVRFALIRDLGPLAPCAGKSHLVNLNARGRNPDEKFIPYGAAK
ncbi:MAG: hypothetical protein ACREHF_01965 [Rhizomicrobium sp.]